MIAALRRVRALVLGVLGVVLLAGAWDLYQAFGPEDGVMLGERTLRNSPETLRVVYEACRFTLEIEVKGWLIGVVVGLLLALLMSRFRIAESALLPWVVLSQTVPLIASAPARPTLVEEVALATVSRPLHRHTFPTTARNGDRRR